jgi:protein-S-isoprenylcysteine O-methyltransferase Ste14
VLLLWASWRWGQSGMLQWSLPLGAVVSMLGLLLRMWATGWLHKDERLATTGPYALTRNPLYLGTFLLTLGHSLMSGLPLAPIIFPALCLILYLKTIGQEEKFLSETFGQEYTDYMARVPRLFPRLLPRHAGRKQHNTQAAAEGYFNWPKVQRCYKGFIANGVVILIYMMIGASH